MLWARHDAIILKIICFRLLSTDKHYCRKLLWVPRILHKAVIDIKRIYRVPKVTYVWHNSFRTWSLLVSSLLVFLRQSYTSLFIFSIFSLLVLSLKVHRRRYVRCQIKSMKIRGSRGCVRQKQWKQIRAMENYRAQKNEKAVIASYKGPRGKVP